MSKSSSEDRLLHPNNFFQRKFENRNFFKLSRVSCFLLTTGEHLTWLGWRWVACLVFPFFVQFFYFLFYILASCSQLVNSSPSLAGDGETFLGFPNFFTIFTFYIFLFSKMVFISKSELLFSQNW